MRKMVFCLVFSNHRRPQWFSLAWAAIFCGPFANQIATSASAQAEKGQDEKHDNDQADDVNDAVHGDFPSREWDGWRCITEDVLTRNSHLSDRAAVALYASAHTAKWRWSFIPW